MAALPWFDGSVANLGNAVVAGVPQQTLSCLTKNRYILGFFFTSTYLGLV
ncbi:hypothetical protein Sjap_018273 [Stephania japonica]|uniref:Uncharacterized protein n=1 Tax=Stephania japonica TaxID=461633 RepID=A0AAP0NKC5_9MAGN